MLRAFQLKLNKYLTFKTLSLIICVCAATLHSLSLYTHTHLLCLDCMCLIGCSKFKLELLLSPDWLRQQVMLNPENRLISTHSRASAIILLQHFQLHHCSGDSSRITATQVSGERTAACPSRRRRRLMCAWCF